MITATEGFGVFDRFVLRSFFLMSSSWSFSLTTPIFSFFSSEILRDLECRSIALPSHSQNYSCHVRSGCSQYFVGVQRLSFLLLCFCCLLLCRHFLLHFDGSCGVCPFESSELCTLQLPLLSSKLLSNVSVLLLDLLFLLLFTPAMTRLSTCVVPKCLLPLAHVHHTLLSCFVMLITFYHLALRLLLM